MAEIKRIIEKIEASAPLETAQKWDNSGWQINLGIKETDRVMAVLDITADIINQAAEKNCGLILSHHPLFFNPVKKIDEPFIIKAVQNNIQIYSAHTNLDIANCGMSVYFAQKCGFTELEAAFDFVRFKHFDIEQDFQKLVLNIKRALNLPFLKTVNSDRKTYKSIAFCSGSGGEFIEALKTMDIDVYVTGDIKHHQALAAGGMTVIDAGHYASEKFASEIFQNILKDEDVEIIEAEEKCAWEII